MINTFCRTPLWECTKTLAAVAQGEVPADVVIMHAKLINVCTAEIQENCDVAISRGRIAYVGKASHCIGTDTQVIDAQGSYIAPGFMDGHIHVESSMIGVGEYAHAVVAHGTTGIYMDPHEICNVLGLDGVSVMAQDAARTPLKTMITTPSCVPAVPGFEDTGSYVGPEDIEQTMNWDNVVGLGEMMNFPGIVSGADHPHEEVAATLQAGKIVTGHYSIPEIDRGLNAYIASGIRCCHESARAEDVLAKMRLGMYAMLRYGTAGQDLPLIADALQKGIADTRFALLVSDDTHPNTLVDEGHLDRIVRKAIELGIDPISAIQMVTINCAQCFQMDHELGSVTPGKCADIVFFDSLSNIQITRTLIDGEVVAENGKALFELEPFAYPEWVLNSMHVGEVIRPETFHIRCPYEYSNKTARVRTIQTVPGQILTKEVIVDIPLVEGCAISDIEQDVLKAFVFERHHARAVKGCGFVKGFGIQDGAIASTVAHDAHNLFVVGTNDQDMSLAANTLIECGGGLVVASGGEVLALVELPIAGLMDALSAEEMAKKLYCLKEAAKEIGCESSTPFMTMAFIPLACLPELRLTNRGLVNCVDFCFVSLFEELSPEN